MPTLCHDRQRAERPHVCLTVKAYERAAAVNKHGNSGPASICTFYQPDDAPRRRLRKAFTLNKAIRDPAVSVQVCTSATNHAEMDLQNDSWSRQTYCCLYVALRIHGDITTTSSLSASVTRRQSHTYIPTFPTVKPTVYKTNTDNGHLSPALACHDRCSHPGTFRAHSEPGSKHRAIQWTVPS